MTVRVAEHVKANPALVASVKDVLQQSFAGELALASLTDVTAGGWPKDPKELAAAASRALERAADNSHVKEYAQVCACVVTGQLQTPCLWGQPTEAGPEPRSLPRQKAWGGFLSSPR